MSRRGRRPAKADMLFLATVWLVGLSACESLRPGTGSRYDAECPKGKWIGQSQLVSDAPTAKTIYLAVLSAKRPDLVREYTDVLMKDMGDHWQVSQTDKADAAKAEREVAAHNRSHPQEQEVLISAGGGMIYMDIDKCSGAMSNVVESR